MAKVLRLHTENESGNNIEHWGNSEQLGDDAINSIEDPQGDEVKDKASFNEVTSIPSPFARIDLMRQAFENVNKSGNLDGNTIYHKMVSDCMDVAEIFFNLDRYLGKVVEVCVWDSDASIQNLCDSKVSEHRLFGNTLKLFRDTDSKNNLKKMGKIFILRYIGEGAPKDTELSDNVIGATSPRTLFFTPAGDLSYIKDAKSIIFQTGDEPDYPFDAATRPLYKRDKELIKYLVCLRKEKDFQDNFEEVAQYIQKNLDQLKEKEELNKITFQDLTIEPVTTGDGEPISILNGEFVLKQKGVADAEIEKSQFTIVPTKEVTSGPLPLVLPDKGSYTDCLYVGGKWDSSYKKKINEEKIAPIDQRTLPGIGIKWPFLCIDDFFEDTLFSTLDNAPKDGEKKAYYFCIPETGNNKRDSNKDLSKLLIPIKKEYFKYFKPEDLTEQLSAEINTANTQVIFTLKIPVKGNFKTKTIDFKKTYTIVNDNSEDSRQVTPILEANGRYLKTALTHTGITILPHLRYPKDVKADYRVTLFLGEGMEGNNIPKLTFFGPNGEELEGTNESSCRNFTDENRRIDDDTVTSITWKVDQQFEAIEIEYQGRKNFIVPQFNNIEGNTKFIFGVDFGTTNTHIAYSVDESNEIRSFNTSSKDAQIKLTTGVYNDAFIDKVLQGDLMPEIIDKNNDQKSIAFPIRTAITAKKGKGWGMEISPFTDANIPFFYEKSLQPDYNENPKTNIKWGTDAGSQNQTKCFIEELAFIMRNKVLMNSGRLQDTVIIWSYPTSMDENKIDHLNKIWEKVYEQYFSNKPTDHLFAIPESVAPLSYFGIQNDESLTIDIGGGTTDIVIANFDKNDEDIKCISSVTFASNSLFGDRFSTGKQDRFNGFVEKFMPDIEAELSKTDNTDNNKMLEKIATGNDASTNLISFFFSLSENKKIPEDIRKSLDFANKLSNDANCKLIILVYYLSIIYYAAQLIKANGLKEPRYIGFSGNGSKVFKMLLEGLPGKRTLALTKEVFEKVLGRPYHEDGLSFKHSEQETPKEATANGCILIYKDQPIKINKTYNIFDEHADLDDDIRAKSQVWLGTSDSTVLKTSESNKQKYNQITDEQISQVVTSIDDFTTICSKVLENYYGKMALPDKTMDILNNKTIFKSDLERYIRTVIGEKRDDDIYTSLFFIPIEGILQKMARELLTK